MWVPQSEQDILLAIAEGSFVESHFLDAKATTGASDGERKETARDLASFSHDGGVLVIGVAEDKQARTFSLAPIPLDGLMEKLEQIAATRIEPPLTIRPHEIAGSSVPGAGYLVVEIPPSPHVPHMVDGRYYARGERTKRQMSDAEVAKLHQVRRREEDRISDLLYELVGRDPVAPPDREHGHLYLVADPLNAPREAARALVRDANQKLNEILHASNRLDFSACASSFSPGAPANRGPRTRANGTGFSSIQDNIDTPVAGHNEKYLSDVEFQEDGGIRGIAGRVTDIWTQNVFPKAEGLEVIFDGLCIAFAHRLIYWTTRVAEETGYRGPWGLGLAANGLLGRKSYLYQQVLWGSDVAAYDRDEFKSATVARFDEMVDDPQAIAYRLVGGLLRGLGTDSYYAAEFTKGAPKLELR